MRNVWTIARKELNSYFRSPIGYIVVAVFAALSGYFFYSYLAMFMQQTFMMAQYAQQYGQTPPVDVNRMLIQPVLSNISVISLILVPFITMRLVAEEKKSGTIELLMTSPITDLQFILGKFFGSLLLYMALLATTVPSLLVLFLYGNPDWKPVLTGYLGLFLLGSCFLAMGLFFSSLTRNQLIAVVLTFGLLLILWVIDFTSAYSTSQVGQIARYLALTTHIDNFFKGVIDLKDTVYYLSVIGLGLFLTARSVESVRWRA